MEQFEQYYRDESGLNRRNIRDNRVHCCLYFISPSNRGWVGLIVGGGVKMVVGLHGGLVGILWCLGDDGGMVMVVVLKICRWLHGGGLVVV